MTPADVAGLVEQCRELGKPVLEDNDSWAMTTLQATLLAAADALSTLAENHCADCCCARLWKALGISDYTGMSLVEHVEALKADVVRLTRELELDREVCICGCSAEAHEVDPIDGESCGDDSHECLRVAPGVAEMFARAQAGPRQGAGV